MRNRNLSWLSYPFFYTSMKFVWAQVEAWPITKHKPWGVWDSIFPSLYQQLSWIRTAWWMVRCVPRRCVGFSSLVCWPGTPCPPLIFFRTNKIFTLSSSIVDFMPHSKTYWAWQRFFLTIKLSFLLVFRNTLTHFNFMKKMCELG